MLWYFSNKTAKTTSQHNGLLRPIFTQYHKPPVYFQLVALFHAWATVSQLNDRLAPRCHESLGNYLEAPVGRFQSTVRDRCPPPMGILRINKESGELGTPPLPYLPGHESRLAPRPWTMRASATTVSRLGSSPLQVTRSYFRRSLGMLGTVSRHLQKREVVFCRSLIANPASSDGAGCDLISPIAANSGLSRVLRFLSKSRCHKRHHL